MQLPTCINGWINNLEKKSSGLTAEKRCVSHLLATCFEIPQVHPEEFSASAFWLLMRECQLLLSQPHQLVDSRVLHGDK